MSKPKRKFLRFRSPKARLFADYHGANGDLRETVQACERLLIELHKGEGQCDVVVASALTAKAIVTYVRAHSGGTRRARLPASVLDAFSEDERSQHFDILEFRHKWIAHSDNAYEDNVAAISYDEDADGSWSVKKVTAFAIKIGTLSGEEAQTLRLLANKTLESLQPEIEKQHDVAVQAAARLQSNDLKAMDVTDFDVDEILAFPGKNRPRW